MTITLYQGNSLEILQTLPAARVHVACTSPPYYGLRAYQCPAVPWPDGWTGHLGGEPTVAAYISHLVMIFREVWRVLRSTGIFFCNMADSYSRNPLKGSSGAVGKHAYMPSYCPPRQGLAEDGTRLAVREKSLCLIPQRLAIALADDGWILRQVMPWTKRNSLPESVRDRPTSALEWWLMCTKQPHYFSDMEAVRQTAQTADRPNPTPEMKTRRPNDTPWQDNRYAPGYSGYGVSPNGRTYRNTDLWFQSLTAPYGLVGVGEELVGLDVPTQAGPSGPQRHYATFSPDLVEPLLRMSTSPMGCCARCKAPVRRVTTVVGYERTRWAPGEDQYHTQAKGPHGKTSTFTTGDVAQKQTMWWEATCSCGAPSSAKCVVLDPFSGRGSTLLAAQRLGLDGIGVELSVHDVEATRQRLTAEAPLLAHIIEGSIA